MVIQSQFQEQRTAPVANSLRDSLWFSGCPNSPSGRPLFGPPGAEACGHTTGKSFANDNAAQMTQCAAERPRRLGEAGAADVSSPVCQLTCHTIIQSQSSEWCFPAAAKLGAFDLTACGHFTVAAAEAHAILLWPFIWHAISIHNFCVVCQPLFLKAVLVNSGVPISRGKIDQRERDVCDRLKHFRKSIRWSQRAFAERIGLTRDQLANIEYRRTPLRYDVACRIRSVFGLSVDWLWGGDMGPADIEQDSTLPLPDATGLPANALLSDVFKKVYGPIPHYQSDRIGKSAEARRVKLDPNEILHRSFIRMFLDTQLDLNLPRVPEGYVKDFGDKLNDLMNVYLKALPNEPDDLVEARYEALLWEKFRRDVAKQTNIGPKTPDPIHKDILDSGGGAATVADMRLRVPTWSELKKEVARYTAERGQKAALAAELGVSRQVLGNWLLADDQGAPNAELTLELFRWVLKQREQKTK